MAGRKIESIRWTIERAAREFGVNPRTLSAALIRENIQPGEDEKFTTPQICQALFGDDFKERIRKTKEEADKLALANSKERGELCAVAGVVKLVQGIGVVLRQKILGSSLLDSEKDDMLLDLQKKFDAGTVTEQVVSSQD